MGVVAPLALLGLAVIALPQAQLVLTPTQTLGLYLAMASAIVCIFDFANVRNALLTLVPPVGGGLMMFGLLGILGIDLNPANLIVLPLILGIGVDDGVHVIHDFRMQGQREYRTSSSTINAIMLTSLTSMIGFGSMMLAAHRGLASLGLVLVIGVGSCLFVSLVTLPAMLTLVSRRAIADQPTEAAESDAGDADVLPFEGPHEHAV
jgi:predicted RND superfamily exporter protein